MLKCPHLSLTKTAHTFGMRVCWLQWPVCRCQSAPNFQKEVRRVRFRLGQAERKFLAQRVAVRCSQTSLSPRIVSLAKGAAQLIRLSTLGSSRASRIKIAALGPLHSLETVSVRNREKFADLTICAAIVLHCAPPTELVSDHQAPDRQRRSFYGLSIHACF